jgi:hypothetical protein
MMCLLCRKANVEIVRLKLSDDSVSQGVEYRDDEVQAWNGSAWVSAPEADPRSSPQFRLAPLVGDHRCDAAHRMRLQIEENLDTAIAFESAASISTSFLFSLGLLVVKIGSIVGLLLIIADALLSIGVAVIISAMTSAVYDELECILYCRLETNGQLTNEELVNVRSDVTDLIGGVAGVVLNLMFDAFGAVMLSNAAVQRTETGDCSACECCNDYFDPMTTELGDMTFFGGNGGNNLALNFTDLCHVGTLGTYNPAGGRTGGGCVYSAVRAGGYRGSIFVDFGHNCQVTSVTFWVYQPSSGARTSGIGLYNAAGTQIAFHTATSHFSGWSQMQVIYGSPQTGRYIAMFHDNNTATGQSRLDDVVIGAT